jgi:hypothetical protein
MNADLQTLHDKVIAQTQTAATKVAVALVSKSCHSAV